MRKRLDIACGLIHRPKVLFLDEPTVGLDIQTRRKIWQYIRKIHKEFGMTIFVSTHYMEEADSLCDRVGIIDYGKIQIVDTPESMKNKLETDMITFSIIPDETKQEQFIQKIKAFDLIKNVEINDNTMVVQSSDSTQVIPKIFQSSSQIGISIDSFVLNKPTLDDVFISYTGHNLRDDTNGKFNKRKEHNQSRRRGL
jgi:ABC-2 type transport system ATP-binding protein